MKHGDTVNLGGSEWRVLAVGAAVGSRTFVHLSGGTPVKQKNGMRPQQIVGWYDPTDAQVHASPNA